MSDLPVIQPGHILTTIPDNFPIPGGGGNWTEKLVGGTFLRGPNPRYGWVSVHDPGSEFDRPLTGLTGAIVNQPHISSSDNPFLHPFGNDFEFHVAPDPDYFDLVAPNMEGSYLTSTNRARNQFDLDVPGVIGMEMDRDLVPGEHQPKDGDRVALWGRLIVDAGHDDFHTEIHPPLVMVNAHQGRSGQQGPGTRAFDATNVQITTRPYLVSQEFDHGGLFNHILVQLGETVANPFPVGHIDAHPRLLPKPFVGLNTIFFDIRPPSPRRRPGDRLILESTLTQRRGGVSIAAIRHPNERDTVRVIVVLNEAGYVPPPEPARRTIKVSLGDLTSDSAAGTALHALITTTAAGLPHVLIVIGKGFPTSCYAKPRAASTGHANSTTRRLVEDLGGNTPTNKDDRQPFPLFGTLKLEWERQGFVEPTHPVDEPLVKDKDRPPRPPNRPRPPKPSTGGGPGTRPQEP